MIFGQKFIQMWVGDDYSSAYYIVLMIFVCTTIPAIQNLGNSILMAYNLMRKKAVIVVFASLLSFLAIFPCAKYYGASGCAVPIFLCIVVAYGPILNRVYSRNVGISVKKFWIEILKMSVVPVIYAVAGYILVPVDNIISWKDFAVYVAIFSAVYLPASYFFMLNNSERNYFISLARRIRRTAIARL